MNFVMYVINKEAVFNVQKVHHIMNKKTYVYTNAKTINTTTWNNKNAYTNVAKDTLKIKNINYAKNIKKCPIYTNKDKKL